MNLTLTTEGSYLHVKDGMFEVQVDNRKVLLSPVKIERILITTRLQLTSDVVCLALKFKIDIVFLDHFGDPIGRVWQPTLGSTARIRRAQLLCSRDPKGLDFARRWIMGKLTARTRLLQELQVRRATKATGLEKAVERMSLCLDQMGRLPEGPEQASSLRGLEGTASRFYFQALSSLQTPRYQFEGRSFRPARDPFNCMLNYGYGILYGQVEKACHIAGLDPHIGFLHCDGYNRSSFVFDFIEPYRVVIERGVVALFSRKKVNQSMFDPLENGVILNKEGKSLLVDAVTEALDERSKHRGRQVRLKHQIQLDAHAFAQELLSEMKEEDKEALTPC